MQTYQNIIDIGIFLEQRIALSTICPVREKNWNDDHKHLNRCELIGHNMWLEGHDRKVCNYTLLLLLP